jgi:hypothetical protein
MRKEKRVSFPQLLTETPFYYRINSDISSASCHIGYLTAESLVCARAGSAIRKSRSSHGEAAWAT